MMRAARFYNKLDIRIDEIPIPVPKENEVLVAVEWCGLCGSDLHEYTDGPYVIPRPGNPHVITKETLPITMGHEFCGRISQPPSNPNSKLKKGDAVMIDPRFYCSDCHRCSNGNDNACVKWGFLGLSGGGGGLSEFIAVPESVCHVLPEGVDLSVAALIEPLAVAYHAVRKTGIEDFGGKDVLVLGGGSIGMAVVVVLRMKGVKKVVVSEPTMKRQGYCRELVDVVLDPVKEKVGDRCRELTEGKGVDVVFDCAGIERAMADGMDALKFGGLYLNVAGWITPFVVPQGIFMTKEMEIRASMAYTGEDFRDTVKAFSAGKFVGIEKFVTSRVLLEDVVEKGLKELINNKDDHVKILFTPKKEYVT
ncbi:threonine dehydrogenase [Mollisia scopiformis]|uniref:Threonine dehydrogenase n=1 Tax=Mollisia scopiformis TaxID=149040 RepID=A0A194XT72_MOLSC|nr:threonine dehydrogenase [Mollisia scopiformis]KUJ23346.1 threonine dehydrogenase [Mollisia scopiformis]